jgi:hypothetical protein
VKGIPARKTSRGDDDGCAHGGRNFTAQVPCGVMSSQRNQTGVMCKVSRAGKRRKEGSEHTQQQRKRVMGELRKQNRAIGRAVDTEAEKRALQELLRVVRSGPQINLPTISQDKESQLKLGRLISEMKLKKYYC